MHFLVCMSFHFHDVGVLIEGLRLAVNDRGFKRVLYSSLM
jgi:hypothetical protein